MVNRAQLRGVALDADCRRAHTTQHEYGMEDERIFCYGIVDTMTDDCLPKCGEFRAFVQNAEPPEGSKGFVC